MAVLITGSLRGRRSKGKGKKIKARDHKLPFPKLPFPSLLNACHAGYIIGKTEYLW